MKRSLSFVCSLLAALVLLDGAHGESHDFWTGLFEQKGLYRPHGPNNRNGCDATEVFVLVGGDGLGFCIEKNERTAQVFEDARQTCAALDKRLPEIAEFKYACRLNAAGTITGLTNMTNNWEWAGNAVDTKMLEWFGNGLQMATAPIAGGGSPQGCGSVAMGGVANGGPYQPYDGGSGFQYTYRCVH